MDLLEEGSIVICSAAVTKFHRLGCLNDKHLFPTVLDTGSLKLGDQNSQVLMRISLLACRQPPSHRTPTWPSENPGLFISWGASAITGSPLSWPHPNPATPEDPASKRQHVELGAPTEGLRRKRKHSNHSRRERVRGKERGGARETKQETVGAVRGRCCTRGLGQKCPTTTGNSPRTQTASPSGRGDSPHLASIKSVPCKPCLGLPAAMKDWGF